MKNTSQIISSLTLASGLALMLMSATLCAEQDAPRWSYEGEEGPPHWGELADEYIMCSRGANQSPIDLIADVHADLPELQFEYYSQSILNEVNNGHTLQQNVKPGSFLKVPSQNLSVELKQFHFHSPSEHTVDGKHFAMELHFVHTDEKGAILVVGVLMDEGEENPVLSKLWSFMPQNAGETSQQPIGIVETNLLPPTRD